MKKTPNILGYLITHAIAYLLIVPLAWSEASGVNPSDNTSTGLERELFESYLTRAESGDAEAQAIVAGMYFNGSGVAKDCNKWIEYLELASAQGHRSSMANLSHAVEKGDCVTQNISRALELRRQAAEMGEIRSLSNLAQLHLYGKYVEKSYVQTEKYFKRAASLGDDKSALQLANLYSKGEFEPSDQKDANFYYLLAADLGNSKAQHHVAAAFDSGDSGLEANSDLAVKYYELAAKQGVRKVNARLAWFYLGGKGFPKNYSRAAELLEECAEENDSYCQANLGLLNFRGAFEKADNLKGYKWLLIAQQNGFNGVSATIDKLKPKLPEQVVAEGEELAKAWLRERNKNKLR